MHVLFETKQLATFPHTWFPSSKCQRMPLLISRVDYAFFPNEIRKKCIYMNKIGIFKFPRKTDKLPKRKKLKIFMKMRNHPKYIREVGNNKMLFPRNARRPILFHYYFHILLLFSYFTTIFVFYYHFCILLPFSYFTTTAEFFYNSHILLQFSYFTIILISYRHFRVSVQFPDTNKILQERTQEKFASKSKNTTPI